LLPAATTGTSSQTKQVALPGEAPAEDDADGFLLPTETGDVMQLHEPKKFVDDGVEQRELRRLTPEEKASRRLKKNLILAVLGGLLLTGAAFALMRFGG
jgi:hypothetical protein